MTLSGLSTQYLRWFSARGASPRTIAAYDLSYRQFVAYLMGVGKSDDLRHFTPENIEAFITYLSEARRKNTSINLKLAALKSLGDYGRKSKDQKGKYFLDENPLDRIYRPKREKPVEKYLFADELRRLLAVPCSANARIAVDLLVDTALRVSEITNANVEHLTMDGDRVMLSVIVKGGTPRTVTLGAEVAGRLLESLKFREARPSEPLLVTDRGTRYSAANLSDLVQRLALRAGITRIPVRAHVIRHSMATLAVASGADVPTVAAMLNHTDIHTVQRYVHRQDAVDAARERVRDVLR